MVTTFRCLSSCSSPSLSLLPFIWPWMLISSLYPTYLLLLLPTRTLRHHLMSLKYWITVIYGQLGLRNMNPLELFTVICGQLGLRNMNHSELFTVIYGQLGLRNMNPLELFSLGRGWLKQTTLLIFFFISFLCFLISPCAHPSWWSGSHSTLNSLLDKSSSSSYQSFTMSIPSCDNFKISHSPINTPIGFGVTPSFLHSSSLVSSLVSFLILIGVFNKF